MTPDEWLARLGGSAAVRREAEHVLAHVSRSAFFARGDQVTVARAPGRLDVIGGIADYSGSLVLEWPLADATFVALQPESSSLATIVSGDRHAELSLPALISLEYGDARAFFARDPESHWAAFVGGAFLVLAREKCVDFSAGARILVISTVPEGKGVSSSAALEVAAMMAICSAYGVALAPADLALFCQRVENLIAGAPCGVMDQMTTALGQSGQLLALLCQPAEVRGHIGLPPGLALWGIDSGIRHAVGGADYGIVRTAAFMGRRMLEDLTGSRIDYVANIEPARFAPLACQLPDRLSGRDFLDRYQSLGDDVTTVDAERVYPVRAATEHPIYEHARGQEFARLLASDDAERLGGLMYESHASYSACGLGSGGTDALVALVRRAGPRCGMYGAKITGGGSGGTVAVLGRTDATDVVESIAAEYASRPGSPARVFNGSSSGAVACGVCEIIS